MIQHVSNKSVSEIFSSDKQIRYFIPKYQRKYTWRKNRTTCRQSN